jgi:hypothetical protein
MLQTLVNGRTSRALRMPPVLLLVVALVSINRISEGPTAHVGCQEIRAAEYCSDVILHNQRGRNPDQHSKISAWIPGSSTPFDDLQCAARIIFSTPEPRTPGFSPLTTTIITSSFL